MNIENYKLVSESDVKVIAESVKGLSDQELVSYFRKEMLCMNSVSDILSELKIENSQFVFDETFIDFSFDYDLDEEE